MYSFKKNSLFLVSFVFISFLFAQESKLKEQGELISYKGNGSYVLVEKTDLRRYENNKYVGLQSREVHSYIQQVGTKTKAGELSYDGSFFIVQETKRNTRSVKKGIRETIASSFTINKDGNLIMQKDFGFPSFRSFPAYPTSRVKIGDTWQYSGMRAVDPKLDGNITKLPILVEYTYVRDDVYNGEKVFVLNAKWATRYGNFYIDSDGDPLLKSATGSHDATILVSKKTGNAIVVKDVVNETFFYNDKTNVSFKGTISLFTKYPPAYNKDVLVRSFRGIENIEEEKKSNQKADLRFPKNMNVAVDSTRDGIRLTIQDIKFEANSAVLSKEENIRLDAVANILKESYGAQFLVEGHTASTGNPTDELSLSKKRAKVIAQALVDRGLNAEQFICKGSGSEKPIADNSTLDGMAKNRRVEITILE